MIRNLVLLLTLVLACQSLESDYQTEIREWQEQRLADLVSADGWITLVGLFRLKEGDQSFGSAPENDIHFPEFAPPHLGKIQISQGTVIQYATGQQQILVNGEMKAEAQLVPSDTQIVSSYDRLQWFIISRGDQYLLRLRDLEHPARKTLTSIPYFPVDSTWRLKATFHPYDSIRTIPLPNALGMMVANESPGYLTFSYHEESHNLVALEGGPNQLFILFYDETSGTETYGAGRYMYVDNANQQEEIFIDFNKAYSPPCAFTSFATCLLPPQENRLPFAVNAGEKDPHFLDH